MTKKEARNNGYRPLTIAYQLPHEGWMLDNVLDDMRRGKIDSVVVTVQGGVELWRRPPMAKNETTTTNPKQQTKP